MAGRPNRIWVVIKTTRHEGKGWLGVGQYDCDEEIAMIHKICTTKKQAKKSANSKDDDEDSSNDDDSDTIDEVSFDIEEFVLEF